jgi:hypothetical protein
MVTIIKVKRKITEDPADCLIIECKKQKTDSADNNNSIKQILKYAGTAITEVRNLIIVINESYLNHFFLFKNDIPDKINELNKNIRKKEEIQNEYKSLKSKSIKENVLNDAKKEIKSQRYVLVNKKRGVNEQNEDINIIDVISTEYLNDLSDETKIKSPEKKNVSL